MNAAIDALIRERCELPSLSTLLRLAGNAHRRINSSQWQQVHERLTALDRQRLDELLTPSADSQDSPFAVMYRGAGKATRDNLKELIAHYEWLRSLPDPAPMLTLIWEAKIGQWANETQRLKARELREYVAPRRYALVLAALRDARGRVLDDMTAMLLKFSKKGGVDQSAASGRKSRRGVDGDRDADRSSSRDARFPRPGCDSESPPEVKQVSEILNMWRFMVRSYESFDAANKKNILAGAGVVGVAFPGFDGNSESQQLSIARFMIERMDMFIELQVTNSHMPTLGRYHRMLKQVEPLCPREMAKRELTVAAVIVILKA